MHRSINSSKFEIKWTSSRTVVIINGCQYIRSRDVTQFQFTVDYRPKRINFNVKSLNFHKQESRNTKLMLSGDFVKWKLYQCCINGQGISLPNFYRRIHGTTEYFALSNHQTADRSLMTVQGLGRNLPVNIPYLDCPVVGSWKYLAFVLS